MAGDPWCETGPRDPAIVASYWVVHFCWLCNIFLGSYGTYRLFTNNRLKKRSFKVLYALISFCFFISPPGFAFGIQSGWECWYNEFRAWEGTYMVGLNGYAYGLALLYIFFMQRAKKVFRKTRLRLNRCVLILFNLGLFIQLTTPIGFTYYFLSGWDEYNRTWALRYFNIFTWTNIASSILVLIVFTRQILTLSTTDPDPEKQINESKNETESVDIEQEMKHQDIESDLLRVITRYMVCAMFALLSTLMVVIIGIIRSEVPSLHDNLAIRGIHIAFHILDETVNLICLSLQFPFGKKLYGICCGCTDSCISRCFLKTLKLQIRTSKQTKMQIRIDSTAATSTTTETRITRTRTQSATIVSTTIASNTKIPQSTEVVDV